MAALQGAQAIEVIPWVEDDKARLPEWVEVRLGVWAAMM